MKGTILTIVFLGELILTSYRSVPSQTDSTPFNTSTGEWVSTSGAAISQDKLCPACRRLHRRCQHPEVTKWVHYGDCLYIEGIGFRVINDCMGRFKHYKVRTKRGIKTLFIKQNNWLDIWVPSFKEEHRFHKQNGFAKHRVWIVRIQKEIPNEMP